MNVILENRRYAVAIASYGAELQAFMDKYTGGSLLWQGDPRWWEGRSPLLFPIVGRLRGDCYCHQGQVYSMPKHGFARSADFAVRQVSPVRVCFSLTDSPESRRIYPFAFTLCVTYTLAEGGLQITYAVSNPGVEPLPFSLGAHPGFACEEGDWLAFDRTETALAHRLDEDKLLSAADVPVLDGTKQRILLTETLFDRGALILEGLRSRMVTLVRPRVGLGVRVCFVTPPPCLGLWAFPRSPYVCIEPWHGLDDTPGETRELFEKPYIQCLAPAQRFLWSMTVTSVLRGEEHGTIGETGDGHFDGAFGCAWGSGAAGTHSPNHRA